MWCHAYDLVGVWPTQNLIISQQTVNSMDNVTYVTLQRLAGVSASWYWSTEIDALGHQTPALNSD